MSAHDGRSMSGTMPSARARSPIATYSFWLVGACCDVAGACFWRTSAAASAQPFGGIISSTRRSDARPASSGRSSSVKRFAADGDRRALRRVRLADREDARVARDRREERLARRIELHAPELAARHPAPGDGRGRRGERGRRGGRAAIDDGAGRERGGRTTQARRDEQRGSATHACGAPILQSPSARLIASTAPRPAPRAARTSNRVDPKLASCARARDASGCAPPPTVSGRLRSDTSRSACAAGARRRRAPRRSARRRRARPPDRPAESTTVTFHCARSSARATAVAPTRSGSTSSTPSTPVRTRGADEGLARDRATGRGTDDGRRRLSAAEAARRGRIELLDEVVEERHR